MQALTVSANAIQIVSNFDMVRAELLENLKAYDIEVTEDNVPEAKRLAAELSDLGKQLNRVKIDKAKVFAAPIEEFKTKAGELLDICAQSREKILAQVKVFEDKRRDLCKALMITYLGNHYGALQVRPEYQTGFDEIPALVGLTMVNKDKLSKAGRDAMESLAQKGRMAQEKADGRMARIEADCHVKGVAPLTREHVASFIDADDTVFAAKLASMIQAEVKRKESQIAKIREEEEAKARAKVDAENRDRLAKEKADRDLAEKMESDRKAVLVKAQEVFKKPEPELSKEALASVPQIQPKEETPAPAENNQPEGPQEEKNVLTFEYRVIVDVSAKATANPEKVKKVVAEIIEKAILAADSRIGSVRVVQ